jgi:uncharacterized protein
MTDEAMSPSTANPTALLTAHGHFIDLLDPKPEDIDIRDIARGLALKCRFGGQLAKPYTVAQHSVEVAWFLMQTGRSNATALAGLLHDAAEAYIEDMPSPVKRAMRRISAPHSSPYDELEARLSVAIGRRFNVDLHPMSQVVKDADAFIFAVEDRVLRGVEPKEGLGLKWKLQSVERHIGDEWHLVERAFLYLAEGLGIYVPD